MSHYVFRYHCQALRHLYVLAAAPRVLITRDSSTNESVSAPVTIHCTVRYCMMYCMYVY